VRPVDQVDRERPREELPGVRVARQLEVEARLLGGRRDLRVVREEQPERGLRGPVDGEIGTGPGVGIGVPGGEVDHAADHQPRAGQQRVAADALDDAADACRELHEIAETQQSEAIGAMAARARGEVALARGDARVALVLLRDAARAWQQLDAPYEAARARALVGQACRALGDEDAATMELAAARLAFTELGAAPALAEIDALGEPAAPNDAHGLTARELEVLRLVAAGRTNKAIAAELVLSEQQRDRLNPWPPTFVSTRSQPLSWSGYCR